MSEIEVGSKEHVPNGKISEILCVVAIHVLDAMGLGSLEETSHPNRRFYIPVVDELSDRRYEGGRSRCRNAAPHQWVNDQAT